MNELARCRWVAAAPFLAAAVVFAVLQVAATRVAELVADLNDPGRSDE